MQYFYEPGSGRKFRSIREVNRYMNGEPHRLRSKTRMPVPFKRVTPVPFKRVIKIDSSLHLFFLFLVFFGGDDDLQLNCLGFFLYIHSVCENVP